MLMLNGKENTFSVEKGIDSFSSDEFIDGNLFTDDDIRLRKEKTSFNACVESISSDSLIGDVESMDEDIGEDEDIYLLKKDLSSKDHFEGMGSKENENYSEKIRPNVNLEMQSSNELIEGIRSVSLIPLKQGHRRRFQSAWSSQPAPLLRSELQSPLNPQVIDFWKHKDKINQDERSKIFKKRKYLRAKDRSFKSINSSQPEIRRQDLVEKDSDDD